MASSYSIYEAKAKLSEVIRNVKNGRETIITERGTPVAKVVPIKRVQSFEERWQELVTRGVILPARRKGPFPRGVSRPGGLARFLEDRD